MDELKNIAIRISHYDIFANILPGALFCIIFDYYFSTCLCTLDNWILKFVIFYFIGIAIDRFGSVVIKNCLEKLGKITFKPYEDFIIAEKNDEKISVLNIRSSLIRSCMSISLFSIIFSLIKLSESCFKALCILSNKYSLVLIVSILLFFLFVYAYCKQTLYIP